MPNAVVIGAGPGGLSAAAMLLRQGVPTVVLEKADAVGYRWRHHYERLHLHTVRWLSHLPGHRIPKQYGKWVARDDVVRYLEGYADHHGVEVRFGVDVTRIDRAPDGSGWPDDSGWTVRVAGGDDVVADVVVVATGHNNIPWEPDWPGRDTFPGRIVHASAYRRGDDFTGQRVLVAGAGNTGAELAVDLVEQGAKQVWIAVRTPPHIVLREQYGVPSLALGVAFRHLPPAVFDPIARATRRMAIGDLSAYGLPAPADGLYERIRRDDAIPIVDVGFVDALKAGSITVVAAVTGFDGSSVCLADGSRLEVDAVVAATGYKRGLEPLVGHLGVLGADGRPTHRGPRTHPSAPGLYFTGFTNPISGMFRELGIDAKRIAKAVTR